MAPRVAIVPPVPVPYRDPLFRMLAERGHVEPHVVYLAASQPAWDQSASWFSPADGYPAEVLAGRQHARPGRSPVTLPRALGAALTRLEPECVVSWEYGPATLRALAWCERRGRPLLVFSELTPWSEAELGPARRRLHRGIAARAGGFIAASSQAAARLAALGVPPERVEVALQSADVARLRAQPGARAGAPVRILAVARHVADKNLGRLIDAFRRAGLGPGEAELELRGSGPLEQELRARAGAGVRVLGPAPAAEMADVYAGADVAALVSTYEPFGVTMREAAAAGLALVCTRRAGAVGDVAVEDENALLVDPESTDEIAGALRRLVRDPELRARLAAGSVAVTERHPPEADAQAWERAILRVTQPSSAGSSSRATVRSSASGW